MKLLKILLKELIILACALAVAIALAKVVMLYLFPGKSEIDIWLENEIVKVDVLKLGLLIFIPLVCLIYCPRFIFFRPRAVQAGIIGFFAMISLHSVIHDYSPVYVQYRLLTGETSDIAWPEMGVDEYGFPVVDDNFFSKMTAAREEHLASIERELLWIQIPFGVITLIMLVLIILTLLKPQKPDTAVA